mmetsp:Transcript_23391/g.35468  ORF Transcript_23391/g.35468 Transcript_23391/m.35468 type:complete len:86 (-) Transcript_23391:3172-3429(-)
MEELRLDQPASHLLPRQRLLPKMYPFLMIPSLTSLPGDPKSFSSFTPVLVRGRRHPSPSRLCLHPSIVKCRPITYGTVAGKVRVM